MDILAIAGYVFTQQFSASQQTQEKLLFEELIKKCRSEEKIGIDFMNAVIENPDVKRYIQDLLQEKIGEIIDARVAENQEVANQAANEAQIIKQLSSQLKNH
jgi:hypothetical protein